MKVWVIMRNDYPDEVFAAEEPADTYVKARMAEQRDPEWCQRHGIDPKFGPRIYYRAYEFEVRDHANK